MSESEILDVSDLPNVPPDATAVLWWGMVVLIAILARRRGDRRGGRARRLAIPLRRGGTPRMKPTNDDLSPERGRAALVTGLVAAPIAWSLQLQLSYVAATVSCGRSLLPIHVVSLLALAVAATSTILSWRGYAPLRAVRREDLDAGLRRTRFLSLLGVFAGGLFVLASVALWIPALVLDPCD